MLTVIDNGVKIQLTAEHHPQQWLSLILISAIFFFAIGIGLMLGWLSVRLSIASIALIAVLSWVWQWYRQKFDMPIITGGELIIQPHQIIHHPMVGKPQKIAIPTVDNINITDNCLIIYNEQGKIAYQILGFQQPQHIKIAEAVLQGKTIQMQGKAIRMQS